MDQVFAVKLRIFDVIQKISDVKNRQSVEFCCI